MAADKSKADGKKMKGAVTVSEAVEVRHPIKAATLLYGSPNYIIRGPIYMVFITLVTGIIYSFIATKDEIVIAPLSLQRETVVMEAVGSGMVSAINLAENAPVQSGDVLVQVQEQIRATASPEQQGILDQIAEMEKERDKIRDDYEFKVSQMELERKDLLRRRDTDLAALKARIETIRTQISSARRARDSAAAQASSARSQLARAEQLFASRDITVTEVETARLRAADLDRQIANADGDIQRVQLQLQTAEQERDQLENATNKERFNAELEKLKENAERDVARVQGRITEMEQRLEQSNTLVRGVRYEGNIASYKAQVDGVVSNIHVRRGQIVGSGTPLVTMVKSSSALEAVTYVMNKDIGQLKHGQKVKIKYFAYPYQEFGIQEGVISDIATRPTTDGRRAGMYRIKIALDRETIKPRNGAERTLEIGLEGAAEVKVGEKRLIELVFTPVSKFFQPPQSQADSGGGNSGAGSSDGGASSSSSSSSSTPSSSSPSSSSSTPTSK